MTLMSIEYAMGGTGDRGSRQLVDGIEYAMGATGARGDWQWLKK